MKVMIVNKTTDTDLIGSNRIKEYDETSSLAEVKYKKIGVGLGLGLSTVLACLAEGPWFNPRIKENKTGIAYYINF